MPRPTHLAVITADSLASTRPCQAGALVATPWFSGPEFLHMPSLDTETRYRLLKLLEQNPDVSQRELAEELGISLGKVNYCLRALIDRGWVKMTNFTRSGNKTAYFYKLTPTGITEKARAARRFLDRKFEEHARITAEIDMLRDEVLGADTQTASPRSVSDSKGTSNSSS